MVQRMGASCFKTSREEWRNTNVQPRNRKSFATEAKNDEEDSSVVSENSNESSDKDYDPMEDSDSIGSIEQDGESLDSNNYEQEPKYKVRFVVCDENHPDARKRFKESIEIKWHIVSPVMLIVFFGICIIIIIIGTMKLCFWEIAWMDS